jgi:hypothetical protein
MSLAVVTGASLACPFGASPGNFIATNNPMIRIGGQTAGNIMDASPNTNITSFGMCNSLANPAVAAATAAAMGVLTPQPCVPNTQAWSPEGAMTLVGNKPMLTQGCTCMCTWGGTIQITDSGQKVVI